MGNVTLVKRMSDLKWGTLNEILRLREMQRARSLLVFLTRFFMVFIIAQNIQRRARKFLFPGYSWSPSSSISKTQGIYHKSRYISIPVSISMFLFLTSYLRVHAMFTIIHPDYTTILKWLKAIQLPISIFSIKIQLHVRTGESSWTIFAYQPTMFLYLSPFKETWIISVLKYINKMHSLSWDSDRKVSQWKGKNLYAGNSFSDFMALYILTAM